MQHCNLPKTSAMDCEINLGNDKKMYKQTEMYKYA